MSTYWHSTTPRARKAHRCCLCSRTIEPGETYRRGAGMGDGTAWTWIECGHCNEFVRVAYRRSWMDDGYDQELLIDFEPNDVAEARIRAQWRRKWRRIDGTLYPLPVVTVTQDKYGFGHPTAIEPGVTK